MLHTKDLSAFIPPGQYRYHRTKLTAKEQEAYDSLLSGLLRFEDQIQVPVNSGDRISAIFHAICYDVPEIFYVRHLKRRSRPLDRCCTVLPEYRFGYNDCVTLLTAMERTVNEHYRSDSGKAEDRIARIHSELVHSVTYQGLRDSYSHEAPGAMIYGAAVCEGIAKAVKFACDRVFPEGKPIVVYGDAVSCEDNPPEKHAWNIVTVDGIPYHLDVTFDNTLTAGGSMRYDYFLLSDRQIGEDHFFEDMPPCQQDFEFYDKYGFAPQTPEQLRNIVDSRLAPGKPLPLVVLLPVKASDGSAAAMMLAQRIADWHKSAHGRPEIITVSCNKFRSIFSINVVRQS
ncbi:MAG: hypothetical protein IKN17_11530 [Ruminococcus sp.]|nr:hypothetical protein [Ruminococcus sp.]